MSVLDWAHSELQQAEAGLEKTWNDAEKEVGKISDDVDAWFQSARKDVEKGLIRTAVAPYHKQLSDTTMKTCERALKATIAIDQSEWSKYSQNIDSSGKGKWAKGARQEITDQSKNLDKILPDVSPEL